MIPPRFNLSRVFLLIPSITGCLVDMATSIMILIVWNAQSIMAVYHKSSCPVSFFTYLIMIVATFIICLTTVLLVSDRYLVATCPYLYAEQVILYTFGSTSGHTLPKFPITPILWGNLSPTF